MNKQSLALAYAIKRMAKTKTMRARTEPSLENELPDESLADDSLSTADDSLDELEPVPGEIEPKESRVAAIIRRLKR